MNSPLVEVPDSDLAVEADEAAFASPSSSPAIDAEKLARQEKRMRFLFYFLVGVTSLLLVQLAWQLAVLTVE